MNKIFVFLLCCAFLLGGCASQTEDISQPRESIAAYEFLGREDYYTFLRTSDWNLLETRAEKHEYVVQEGNIICEEPQGTSIVVEEGITRILYLPIYAELIHMWGCHENVSTYLRDNHIADEVEEVALIFTTGLPECITIKTKADMYFVSIDLSDNAHEPQAEKYIYQLHKQDDYAESIVSKQVRANFNNKDILIVKHRDFSEIPLVAVCRALGADVHRNGNVFTLSFDGKTITVEPNNYRVLLEGDEVDLWDAYFRVDGDEVYINDLSAQTIVQTLAGQDGERLFNQMLGWGT